MTSQAPQAALIAVGTELVSYGRTDANGVFLARLLARRGIAAGLRQQVPDDERSIATALSAAAQAFPVTIVTGGLGPTVDDRTREAIALAFGTPLREDPLVLAGIHERLRSRGRPILPASARQAQVPLGASVLANLEGTAPGLHIVRPDGAMAFFLPGVPHEMRRMAEQEVAPRLPAGAPLAWQGMKVSGMTEMEVQQTVLERLGPAAEPRLTILASPMEITVILRGDDPEQAARLAAEARAALGPRLVSHDADEGLEHAVASLFSRGGATLAAAESCTGGLLGAMLTRLPGASSWFLQGWVTYSDAAKSTALGIDAALIARHGAVSEEVAGAMASAAARLSGATHAVSITGIAGPAGATADKPVGLVYIGLHGPGGLAVTRHRFPGDREAIRLFAARTALDRLRLDRMRPAGTP
ncbi:MAG TPA: CinA family nicotinamide mononucleotide deamidase-related protein [Candidatus Polarisedimenticolia bacterium]|nr:CinA family nicotinamide mononucleotide deamidase-related protein [Candidatus Polarisedimenticolia bacterium]